MTEMMRIAICDRPGHIEVKIRPVPSLDRKKVMVKVTLCGVCGSDLAVWRGSGHKRYPYSPGHEFCGIVKQTGREARGLRTDQRVVINPNLGCGECSFCCAAKPNLCDVLKTRPVKSNGGFSEYVALDYRMVYPLPDALPDNLAPFVEPLSCALHTAETAEAGPGERVAVFGAGIMGTLTGLAAQRSGSDVMFIEPAEKRRAQLGALFDAATITPQELTGSEWTGKFDAAIDCSGSAQAVSQAISILRKAGRLVLTALVTDAEGASLPLIDVTTKELVIKGAWLNPNTFEHAISLAVEHSTILKALKTETFDLDNIAAAFERASARDVSKVLVRP